MSWYFKKSVSFGPLRINFSKTGVGASVGVRGARISVSRSKGVYATLSHAGFYDRIKMWGKSK